MIGYRVWSGLSPDITETALAKYDMSFNPQTAKTIDTFSIQTLERDPFLGTLSSPKNLVKLSAPRQKPIETELLPSITYNGMLKKQSASDQVFVVNINANQFLLKKGQTADSVKLVNGNENEISVRYRNRSLTIKRQ